MQTQPSFKATQFRTLWILCGFFHLLSIRGWFPSIEGSALLFIIIIGILAPSSNFVFYSYVVAACTHTFLYLPSVWNHIFFEFLVNVAFILGLLVAYAPSGTTVAIRGMVVEQLMTRYGQCSLILLYLFAALSKFNFEFLDPRFTCAVAVLADVHTFFGINESVPIASFFICLTIGVELGIPLLLCRKSTRLAGVAIGLVFHFFLGLDPGEGVYGFSFVMLSLLILFLPVEYFTSPAPLRVRMASAGVALSAVFIRQLPGVEYSFGTVLWAVWYLALALPVLSFIWTNRFRWRCTEDVQVRSPTAWWLVLIPLIANGFSPYFGLKSNTAFLMFSNLHLSEQRTNHVFMPAFLYVPQEFVTIIDSDVAVLKWHADEHLRMHIKELRRIVSGMNGGAFFVRLMWSGQEFRIDDGNVRNYPVYAEPLGFLESKFVVYRPEPLEQKPCK